MSIKEIVTHAVDRVGGQIQAAKILGVSKNDISLWCNHSNTRFIPIDHLVDLDAWAGDLFLKDWAAKRGFDLTPREAAPTADNALKTIGQFARAGGELECTTLEAMSDHILTNNDKRDIREHIRPVKDFIEQLERIAQ